MPDLGADLSLAVHFICSLSLSEKQVALHNKIVAVQAKNIASADPRAFRHADGLVVDYFIISYLLGGAW